MNPQVPPELEAKLTHGPDFDLAFDVAGDGDSSIKDVRTKVAGFVSR